MDILFGKQKITLQGNPKSVGDQVQDFSLINNDLAPVKLSDFNEPYLLFNVVPSLDTGVCDMQTKTVNKALNDLHHLKVITVSNDLPFAQKRWCGNDGMANVLTLSDYKDLEFAQEFGTLIAPFRLQARAVFVLDSDRRVIYKEIVENVSNHPSYDALINFIESLK